MEFSMIYQSSTSSNSNVSTRSTTSQVRSELTRVSMNDSLLIYNIKNLEDYLVSLLNLICIEQLFLSLMMVLHVKNFYYLNGGNNIKIQFF